MKFLDMFTPIEKGDYALTDEAIYKLIQHGTNFIPIWGGNREHNTIDRMVSFNGRTKKGKSIKIFGGNGIIISLDGSAGYMTYKPKKEKFALNHHAGFFKVREKSKDIIHPLYFIMFFQKQLEEMSVSEGSKTLTPDQIYESDFDIPEYNEQVTIIDTTSPVFELHGKLITILDKIIKIKKLTLAQSYSKYQSKNIPVTKILKSISGNSGLTEQEIYKKSFLSGKRFTILSGSTKKETKLGEIPLCEINGKKLTVFENHEGILVIRKGKAGMTFYMPCGNYTMNDDAYFITVLEDTSFLINIKWVLHALKNDFLDYSSSADNGTWNKTKFFKEVYIDIPVISEQISIVEKYNELEKIELNILTMVEQINKLLSKQIVVV